MPENISVTNSADFDRLREQGFTEDEATRLVYMKDHVGEQIEYREMLEVQHRLDFIRWLVEHKRLSE